jgi:hypothetical protein
LTSTIFEVRFHPILQIIKIRYVTEYWSIVLSVVNTRYLAAVTVSYQPCTKYAVLFDLKHSFVLHTTSSLRPVLVLNLSPDFVLIHILEFLVHRFVPFLALVWLGMISYLLILSWFQELVNIHFLNLRYQP